ncbi:PRC-barrel domain-containing protein [Streptomyces actuosus]|uniref:PRC-barrel domain-containing protein n=1 Tax=Streptomyces actuosus TaxID=1885 RepID=A0ABS2VI71_STRAS|nr:PRC-barrel domain-containing protein [Streptomyces actuosus]MBN0042789.1 PRC-barrel domain-containing protein [Streptomyces actuosus]
MLFSEARGRAVMELTSAETVGTVAAVTVAPSPARITALRLKTRGRGHDTLDWAHVASFGPDAVAVEEAGHIRDAKDTDRGDATHTDHDPLGKAVFTETGLRRGTVIDVEFDEQSGDVRHLLTDEEQIPGADILGVGGYAVVVGVPRETAHSTPS